VIIFGSFARSFCSRQASTNPKIALPAQTPTYLFSTKKRDGHSGYGQSRVNRSAFHLSSTTINPKVVREAVDHAWFYGDYPALMKNSAAKVRHQAIAIANVLLDTGNAEGRDIEFKSDESVINFIALCHRFKVAQAENSTNRRE
jgi:hypothetical protein